MQVYQITSNLILEFHSHKFTLVKYTDWGVTKIDFYGGLGQHIINYSNIKPSYHTNMLDRLTQSFSTSYNFNIIKFILKNL